MNETNSEAIADVIIAIGMLGVFLIAVVLWRIAVTTPARLKKIQKTLEDLVNRKP